MVTDLKAEDVVLEHRSYCSARARERNFAGDVLGYVTPVSWDPVVQKEVQRLRQASPSPHGRLDSSWTVSDLPGLLLL